MRGQPDVWTIEDLEEARDRANDMMLRGRGPKAAPARESWRKRARVTLRARRLFRIVLGRKLALLKKADPHAHRHRARLRRKAIQQALVDLGYLEIRTGWVRARSTGPGNTTTYR
jgi:hypothetical protein